MEPEPRAPVAPTDRASTSEDAGPGIALEPPSPSPSQVTSSVSTTLASVVTSSAEPPPAAHPVTTVVSPPAGLLSDEDLAPHAPLAPRPAPQPPAGSTWDDLTNQVITQTRREGTWKVVARALLAVIGVVFALRLVFDEALTRVIALALVSVAVLFLAAMVVQAISEARRQRALLIALAHLVRLSRKDPALGAQLVTQVDSVLTALRTPPRVWPWGGDELEGLVTLLAQYSASAGRAAPPAPPRPHE